MQNVAISDELLNQLTRRERKHARRLLKKSQRSFSIKRVDPKTRNQRKVFEAYNEGQNLLCHGVAGTGKTFLSIYLSLKDILERKYNQLIIVRSAVATRDIGYLPGTQAAKTKVYEAPYVNIATQLFNRGDAYENLKVRGMVNFTPTSFIRGVTLDDSIVLVDECQNLTFHELDSIITRLGENSKIIFSGDFRQTDLQKNEDKQGLRMFMDVLNDMDIFSCIEFNQSDIVRSQIVRDYIITKLNYGLI